MATGFPNLPTFGARLEWARKRAGYKSQQAFADDFNVTKQTIGRLERGEYPPGLDQVGELAAKLGVDPAWLGFGHGAPYRLPEVEAYLRSEAGKKWSPEVANLLLAEAYWIFPTLTPTDAQIEVAALLLAHLLGPAAQSKHGDKGE